MFLIHLKSLASRLHEKPHKARRLRVKLGIDRRLGKAIQAIQLGEEHRSAANFSIPMFFSQVKAFVYVFLILEMKKTLLRV